MKRRLDTDARPNPTRKPPRPLPSAYPPTASPPHLHNPTPTHKSSRSMNVCVGSDGIKLTRARVPLCATSVLEKQNPFPASTQKRARTRYPRATHVVAPARQEGNEAFSPPSRARNQNCSQHPTRCLSTRASTKRHKTSSPDWWACLVGDPFRMHRRRTLQLTKLSRPRETIAADITKGSPTLISFVNVLRAQTCFVGVELHQAKARADIAQRAQGRCRIHRKRPLNNETLVLKQ